MTRSRFLERLQAGGVLVADGATGTNLQARGMALGVPGETWVLQNPDAIAQLHRDFIEAGADIVLTCTFGGSAMRLEQTGFAGRMEEINRRAVELARTATEDVPALVAGSIGPLGHLLKPLGAVEEADAVTAYRDQARILDEAGVDLLVIETQYDLAEARAAIRGVRSVSSLPLVCSFSFDRGTRTMMGVRPEQIGKELPLLGVDVVGINCGRSLDENFQALQELAAATSLPLWFKPNAGLPRMIPASAGMIPASAGMIPASAGMTAEGSPVYDLTPERMEQAVSLWVKAGARIVGGCCGTSPDHLRAIARAVRQP